MIYNTNFLHGSTDEADEIRAYDELRDYLIKNGKYSDAVEADDDAGERVEYFDGLGLYNEDSQLINASIYRKKTHALIYAHGLHDVIVKNSGFLPDAGLNENPETDPLKKLVDMANSEVASGASKDSVIKKLILSGLDPEKAETFANTIISSRNNHFSQVAKYLGISIIIFAMWFWALTSIVTDKNQLTHIAKYDFMLFIALMAVFGLLSKFGGKVSAYLRYGTSYFLWLSVATLSGLLFLQDSWAESLIHVRGGPIGILFSIINIAISIGPKWLGLIFGFLSFALLVMSWAEDHKIKEGIFEVEE